MCMDGSERGALGRPQNLPALRVLQTTGGKHQNTEKKSTQRVAAGAEGTHLCAEMGADSEQLMDFPAGSEGCKEPSQVHLPLYMLNT